MRVRAVAACLIFHFVRNFPSSVLWTASPSDRSASYYFDNNFGLWHRSHGIARRAQLGNQAIFTV